MLERTHLALLLALDDCGTLARAADQLCLTQSALSHSVRKLEQHYEVQLWQKEGRKLRLTQAGQYLLALAKNLVPQFEQAEDALKAFAEGKRGKLRIGMECHPCYEWLLTIVSPFLNRWPDVDLDVIQQFRFNGLEALQNHQVDVVITSDPLEDAAFINEAALAYELLLVTATNTALASREFAVPADLKAQTLFTFPVARERLDVFTQFLIPGQTEPQKHHRVEATEIMVQLVAANRGVCTLPDWLAQRFARDYGIKTWSLGRNGVHKQLYLVFRREDSGVSYIQDFVALSRT